MKISSLQYVSQGETEAQQLAGIEALCRAGISWVQLRIKHLAEAEILPIARKVQAICRAHGATFLVNDSVNIARELEADGVHLGKADMSPLEARKLLGPNAIIGGTANDWADIRRLAEQAVDYIGLGPFRFTSTKRQLSPILGLEGYAKLMRQMTEAQIKIPVVAIGGIALADATSILQSGVHGLAISGYLYQQPASVSAFHSLLSTGN